jgi:protein-disulfide isomerase
MALGRPSRTVSAVASPRLTPNRILVAVLAVAAVLAAVLIVVSVTGGSSDTSTTSPTVQGSVATERLLAGIPQSGNVLGRPDAPVTIVEFADLQCPACRQWALETLPAVVDEYVRPGKVKLVFDGVSFIGPDSLVALKTAGAAAQQDKLWNVVELLYHNQGEENRGEQGKGWVTEDLLKAIGESVKGLDAQKMLDERESPAVAEYLATAQGQWQAAGGTVTPTFGVGKSNEQLTKVEGAVSADGFRQMLDQLLTSQ